ncbi:hypothetical protein KY284_033443 [Solanum tuberosum]|nr:hypothetical protein KY284_033443 [Solanum tuberosum]
MCPHKDWFVTYDKAECGIVLMGNDAQCKVVEISIVQIKTHDGVIRTLTNVHHISDLKHNLISLGSIVTGSVAVSTSLSDDDLTHLWHMRMGNMSDKGMTLLSKRGLLGKGIGKLGFCEHCIFEKQKRVSFSAATHRTLGILDYVHSYLWGPSKVPSLGGKRYMMTITDDFSRKVWVYFLRHKNEAFLKFKNFKALVENQTGRKIKKTPH